MCMYSTALYRWKGDEDRIRSIAVGETLPRPAPLRHSCTPPTTPLRPPRPTPSPTPCNPPLRRGGNLRQPPRPPAAAPLFVPSGGSWVPPTPLGGASLLPLVSPPPAPASPRLSPFCPAAAYAVHVVDPPRDGRHGVAPPPARHAAGGVVPCLGVAVGGSGLHTSPTTDTPTARGSAGTLRSARVRAGACSWGWDAPSPWCVSRGGCSGRDAGGGGGGGGR